MPEEPAFASLPHRPYLDPQMLKNQKDTFQETAASSFKDVNYRDTPKNAKIKKKDIRRWHSQCLLIPTLYHVLSVPARRC